MTYVPDPTGVRAAFHVFEIDAAHPQPPLPRKGEGAPEGGLTFDLPLGPGVYAFAYRFVRLGTGQATPMQKLGVLEVSG